MSQFFIRIQYIIVQVKPLRADTVKNFISISYHSEIKIRDPSGLCGFDGYCDIDFQQTGAVIVITTRFDITVISKILLPEPATDQCRYSDQDSFRHCLR
jgi:hypothetical protein